MDTGVLSCRDLLACCPNTVILYTEIVPLLGIMGPGALCQSVCHWPKIEVDEKMDK